MSGQGTDVFDLVTLYLVSAGPKWVVRKVDSFRLMDGPANDRRVSLDLEVPASVPRVPFLDEPRWVLPLAVLKKGPLTSFDATFGKGDPLSIADRETNAEVAFRIVVAAFEYGLSTPASAKLRSAIRTIVNSDPSERLISHVLRFHDEGQWMGMPIPDELGGVSREAWDLLALLFENYLLCGVFQDDPSGKRLLVKYRYSWEFENRLRWFDVRGRILAPLGLATLTVAFDLGSPYVKPKSYHLEVHSAPESQLEALYFPAITGPVNVEVRADLIHAVAKVDNSPLPPDAIVSIAHQSSGRLASALWATVLAMVFFGTIVLWEPALHALVQPQNRPAASLLTSLPAIYLAVAAGRMRNRTTEALHAPLRGLMVLLGVSFLATAFVLVVGVGAATFQVWASTLFLLSGVLTTMLLVGRVFRSRSS